MEIDESTKILVLFHVLGILLVLRAILLDLVTPTDPTEKDDA